MRFIEITPEKAVNVESIDYLSKNVDGFAMVHVGIEILKSNFPYASLVSLLGIGDEKNQVGDGPNPSATALAY